MPWRIQWWAGALFQEHEGQAAELLPVVAGDDRLLVGLGDGDRIAQAQLALFHQYGVAESQQLGIVGQPVGNLDAGDLGAAVQVVEVAPLLAGGQTQGELGRQVAGPVQSRAVARFQQQLEHLPVVEAGGAVAARQVGAAGGAEPVAVGVALVAEHEVQRATYLGGAGPRGVGGHGHRTPIGGRRPQTGQGGLQALSDESIGDVAGVLASLQVPEGQGAVQQGEYRPIVGRP